MKGIIFLACVAFSVYCLVFGILCLVIVEETFGKCFLSSMCFTAAAVYGWFAYERYRKLKYPWA